ncbi:hypothetical protein CFC21_068614 [Triticum aestivum]|uniref:F-box domain-containing protein n=2 Tax=Triticum aestivum TaxID=4565 RepID=A0A9R1HAQ0_WHEAT|nr:probable F-box protein At2g36090 [Triticum aestivum]KAF7061964.1 hypothetical protein CFC21_068614 [Triticum aestivum]
MRTTTIEDLPADVLACALRRLDGPSLAAASCATAGLRAIAADPATWRALCLAQWPSLDLETLQQHNILGSAAVSPPRLFADAFPFPSTSTSTEAAADQCLPGELISAVDVYHTENGAPRPLFSRVVETSTSSSWFLASPFRVDAVECKDPVRMASASFSPAELELSWIVVDPRSGRAVNVSSRRAVAVDRHWYTGETLVRYAVVLGGSKFEATITCSEEAGCLNLREVSLTVEDADGAAVSGEGSLRLLAAAMEAPRSKAGEREREEAKRRYEEFVRSKRGRKESKARREVLVDLCCSAVSAVAVLSFLASVALR